MVVPANRVVALSIVSADVAHSWWIPALGGKTDAIPGRTNHSWFKADGVASYDGQCAELCGLQHALMKARVQAVSEANYTAWTAPAPEAARRAERAARRRGGRRGLREVPQPLGLGAQAGRPEPRREPAADPEARPARRSSRNGVGQMPAVGEGLERRGGRLARVVLQAGSAQGRRRRWRLEPSPSARRAGTRAASRAG